MCVCVYVCVCMCGFIGFEIPEYDFIILRENTYPMFVCISTIYLCASQILQIQSRLLAVRLSGVLKVIRQLSDLHENGAPQTGVLQYG